MVVPREPAKRLPGLFERIGGRPTIERIVEERNRSLASYETIKKFAILERALTVEDGDLTPTLKLRRQALTHKYMRLLDSFYEDGF